MPEPIYFKLNLILKCGLKITCFREENYIKINIKTTVDLTNKLRV